MNSTDSQLEFLANVTADDGVEISFDTGRAKPLTPRAGSVIFKTALR